MTNEAKEKIEFKAEVAQVLNLVIHSLYSHREVFLRELISNASDALDKHRHLALTDEKYKTSDAPAYAIKLAIDKKKQTLTISDNGIGMSREEVIQNLGTIASSGTKAFLEQMAQGNKDSLQLIGQFGVGFYSSFMVASKVKVVTRRAVSEEAAVSWESDGTGGYTLEEAKKEDHGTEITLYLKDDAKDYLEEFEIKEVVKKYSDYVSYPIILIKEKNEEETINKVTAIWRRPKNEIKEEEYFEFYKYISHDFEDPLLYTHHSIEGALEFKLLLFIPKKRPVNFFRDDIHGLRLHVKKMFVTDQCKELIPVYLRFVKGVVDSEDLPLNISRETLQHNALIPKIRKQLTKKIFDLLEELAEKEPEKYREFFLELGVALKEGITMDFENRDRILELLRFKSSAGSSEKDLVSLKEYVERMKPEQKEIYYIAGTSREACQQSPHLELFRSKGIEVLFMDEVIDEWVIPSIPEYQSKKLKSITKGDLDLGDLDKEAKKEKEKADTDYKLLTDRLRSALQEQVKEVRISVRLNESPCCLVADENDMDANMEHIMKAMGREFQETKRILEINPQHAVIKNIKALLDKDPKDVRIETWASLLFNQALIAEGKAVKDPTSFVRNLNELLENSTGA